MPLTTLSAAELRARADELDDMASTARTADTRDALRRLASRYAHLAQARAGSEDQGLICRRSDCPEAHLT